MTTPGTLFLHPLLADDAVLQCEKPLPIRGTAPPHARVRVEFAGLTATTNAEANGTWSLVFEPLPAGGPHRLIATTSNETIQRNGVMLGEVWLCSGQSNMEWTLGMLPGLEADIEQADDPLLRCFTVPRTLSVQPSIALTGTWRRATPETARDFSATAYFFARRLRAATNRPVGIITSAVGGTLIASWLPHAVLTRRPEYGLFQTKAVSSTEEADAIGHFAPHPCEAVSPDAVGWTSPDWNDRLWPTLPVPGYWQDQGWMHNGAVWYRQTTELPEAWRDRDLILEIGACDDFDDTFVNGQRVGGIGPEAPNAYAMRRTYRVPAALVSRRRVTIAVRIFDQWGNGGITQGVWLRRADQADTPISLNGSWKAKVEKALPLRAPKTAIPPSVLFNGMIHPLIGHGLRGFIWYQGESDAPRAALYRLLLADLIAAWRTAWDEPTLPFGIVQLANHQARSIKPVESDWAELRDAQLFVARTVPGTGLAVAIDVGEAANIHPVQKRPVGERLARWALATVFGCSEEPWSSPLVADHWIEGGQVYVRFDHTGAGLHSRSGLPIEGFQIAGDDRRWHWAYAKIERTNLVRVWSPEITQPVAVRYAWQSNPACSLENSAGLPASPFRTDDWPLTTLQTATSDVR